MKEEFQQSTTPATQEEPESRSFLFNLDMAGIEILLERKFDINQLYVLTVLERGEPLLQHTKMQSWIQTLQRKGLVSEAGNITLSGRALLQEVSHGIKQEPVVYTKQYDPFEKWWKEAHPATDFFEYKGVTFNGSQSKHHDKEGSRKEYWDIINEGEYSCEDIFWATVVNVENAKELSLKTGISEIHFIANSKRYLKERKFIPFIDAGRRRRTGAGQTQSSALKSYDFDI